jgi:hypothetical protein
MSSQRDMVRASLLVQAARETHHDVYSRRRARPALAGVTPETVARQIGDLSVLLESAETPETRSWLVLRLRNRLDLYEAMETRGGCLR